ncbi:MAG: ImmA/IrrE family metallo-endopeptidase [Jatrophihabitantaceae bacterium]
MHTTTNQPGGSVLASLRFLAPAHPITLDEALRLAERQAALLLELCGSAVVPVPTSIITNQPRITVENDPDLPAHAASGCSDWDSHRRTWVISLNPTEPRRRQRFTVLHEYKHVIDHPSPGIRPSRYAYQRPAAEIVADYFAGCVLIPKRQLAAAYYDGIQRPTDLAQLFDVSKEAIQVRLAQTGLAEPPLVDRHRRTTPGRVARYYRSAESHLMEVAA